MSQIREAPERPARRVTRSPSPAVRKTAAPDRPNSESIEGRGGEPDDSSTSISTELVSISRMHEDQSEPSRFAPARVERVSLGVREELPTLATEAFHGLAGDYVREVDPHTEADPAAILCTFLAAFGNAVGRTAHICVENDRHYPNLFACIVGATSSGRKGTSAGQALRLFERADPLWREQRVVAGLSSGEGLIAHLQGDDPARPQRDKRAFVLEPEFASVLRVATRDGNTLSAQLRTAWDGGILRVMTRKQPLRVDGAHLSIIGHITRDELRRNLDSTEIANGFANRFLWLVARRSKVLPEGGAADRIDWRPMVNRLKRVLALARTRVSVVKSAEAVRFWAEIYPKLSAERPGLQGAIVGRAPAQILRLALIYALLDSADTIEEQHLVCALAIWEFAAASAAFIFGDSTGNRDADRIWQAICEKGGGTLTLTEVAEVFARNGSRARVTEALIFLEESGRIVAERILGKGRPRTEIRAIPKYEARKKRSISLESA